MKSIFSENSKTWNEVWKNDSYSVESLTEIKSKKKTKLLLKYVEVNEKDKIGDFGCGGGYLSEELYDNSNCEIIGIDFSDIAINLAKGRLKAYPIKFIKTSILVTALKRNL